MQYEYTKYSSHGLEMLEKQKLCKDYMQDFESGWKLCDVSFLALWERESRHFNDESTSNVKLTNEDNHIKIIVIYFLYLGITLFPAIFLGCRKFCDYRLAFKFFPQCIIDMLCYCLLVSAIKLSDLQQFYFLSYSQFLYIIISFFLFKRKYDELW